MPLLVFWRPLFQVYNQKGKPKETQSKAFTWTAGGPEAVALRLSQSSLSSSEPPWRAAL